MKHELVQSNTVLLTILEENGQIKMYSIAESENVIVDTVSISGQTCYA